MLHSSWLTFLRASALCSLGPTSPRLSVCGLSPLGALLLSRRSLRLCTSTEQSNQPEQYTLQCDACEADAILAFL